MAGETEPSQEAQVDFLSTKISDKKRTGKFLPLRKLFGKKKKKSTSLPFEDGTLKSSLSIGNVCNTLTLSSDDDACEVLSYLDNTMGTRAFSHDSIFIPDGQAEDEHDDQRLSQEYLGGKVKSLQQQLAGNIRFGQPPSSISGRRLQDLNVSSEQMEETHSSPMEILGERDTKPLENADKVTGSPGSMSTTRYPLEPEQKSEEKVTPVKLSRPKRPLASSGTIESINLDAVPCVVPRLDNSAAKHKLSVKPKNQRVSKKHRGMSQHIEDIEFENESDSKLLRNADRSTFCSMETSKQDTSMSGLLNCKMLHEQTFSKLQTLAEKQKAQDNKQELGIPQGPVHVTHEYESRCLEKERVLKIDAQKQEEERNIRHGIHKGLEIERKKIEEQKVTEMKEQQSHVEELKQRAEQRHQELEEQQTLQLAEEQKELQLKMLSDRQHIDKQKQQELEEQRIRQQTEEQEQQRIHQQAEERKQRELEEQRINQQAAERKRKLEEQKICQQAEERKQRGLEEEKMHQQAEERKQCELEEQRTHQQAEEQKQHELREHTIHQQIEEQKQRELNEERINQQAEEQKKCEVEELLIWQKTEDQRQGELQEQIFYHQSEKQRGHELELQKTHQQTQVGKQGLTEVQQVEKQQWDAGRHRTEEQQTVEEQKDLHHQGVSVKTSNSYTQEQDRFMETVIDLADEHSNEKHKINETNANDKELKQRKQKQIEQQELIGKELRWQELDQRQRPFTFKVSSGENQIIFEKVHLSPVSPSKEPPIHPDTQKDNKPNISSIAVLSAQFVPHTAILVTGAQLCDTALNLNQIQDTACKSLLGLTEERRHLESIQIKSDNDTHNAKQMSSKTKYTSESMDNQSFLAEWASIRSKILSKSENSSLLDKDRRGPRICSDDWTSKGKSDSHSNLRKTLSATAKFSITPAWQKFPEIANSKEDISYNLAKQTSKENPPSINSKNETQDKTAERTVKVRETVTNKIKKQVTIDGNSEGWIFSKDLPSFLVPNPPESPRRGQVAYQSVSETQMSNSIRKSDRLLQNTEEKLNPFGIKLRRTNYSLRFNSDPQNEQRRKKRYSAGDSFDGVPVILVAADEAEIRNDSRYSLSVSPTKVKKGTAAKIMKDNSNNPSEGGHSATIPQIPTSSSYVSSPIKDRMAPKSPTIQKPSLAPKPTTPTPPSSPLSQLDRTSIADQPEQRLNKSEQDKELLRDDIKVNAITPLVSHCENEENETKDQKCSFPSIPWRERCDKRPDQINRERPVLQSRHSLDGSRLMDQIESAQPLWITLALQKQKGFREQQASRDERRQAREAKQADKLAKENTSSVQTGVYRSRSGSLQKPPATEEKKETVVTRLQRREQLQKSNTLPTSATVEMSETIPGPPLGKDIPKRFSTPDAAPVSSEPAWLALAKRKSKAWSDCPQIIK
ncbi:capping protein-inhibiting regulator of actin dynamics isoform X2 [Spea bombifrons]|nr:capping protein-inhibiting regulator of actin dynamics isoform X2 [Spea bombifrons]